MDTKASITESLLTLSLMFSALDYSSVSIWLNSATFLPPGIMSEIKEVPSPSASCNFLMSLLSLYYS